jgi:hypothetical protein
MPDLAVETAVELGMAVLIGYDRGMPLTLRPAGLKPPADHEKLPDWSVMSGEFVVGRIYEVQAATQPESRWFWVINGVHAGPDVMQKAGYAPTFDRAKAALKANWEYWLTWAKLKEE